MLTYDINAAIEFRSTNSTVLTDSYDNKVDVDFKTSISLAKDEMFMFGYGYGAIQQLGFNNRRDVTKTEFKAKYSSYRKYYFDIENDSDLRRSIDEDQCPGCQLGQYP